MLSFSNIDSCLLIVAKLLLVNHQLFALNQYVMLCYPWLLWHYRCLTIFRECSTSVVHYTSIIVWRSKRVDCCSVNQKIVPCPWKKEQGYGLARYITKVLILFSLSLLLLSYLGWDQFLELPGNVCLAIPRRSRYFKRKCFEIQHNWRESCFHLRCMILL